LATEVRVALERCTFFVGWTDFLVEVLEMVSPVAQCTAGENANAKQAPEASAAARSVL
jgi:hypothetical protein